MSEGKLDMVAATIIVAREDLSIPGTPEIGLSPTGAADENETRFFKLVRDSRPDVILLDVTRDPSRATDAIVKIRRQCAVPILVGCDRNDPGTDEYRRAGAADCMETPFDIRLLNAKLKQIIVSSGRKPPQPPSDLRGHPQWRV